MSLVAQVSGIGSGVRHVTRARAMTIFRKFLALWCIRALAVALPLLGASVGPSHAQDFPSRPLKIIVPFPAGGLADQVSRLVGAEMGRTLGQPVVVENRPGTGGLVGMEAAARSDPDGYTLIYSSAAAIVTGPLMRPSRKFVDELEPVGHIGNVPIVLVARAGFPARTVQELVAHATANPGKVTYGSSGVGSSPHLIGEYFKSTAGIDMLHVPYAGDQPIMVALLGGHLDIGIVSAGAAAEHIRAGKLRGLALTGSQRTPLLKDTPTVAESGYPGFAADSFGGFHTRAGTPKPYLAKLTAAMKDAVRQPDVREHLERLSVIPVGAGADQYGDLVRSETNKWAKLIRQFGIKLE